MQGCVVPVDPQINVCQGCTTYFTDSTKISLEGKWGPQWGSGGCAPSKVQGQSPWSGDQGDEAVDDLLIQQQNFSLIAMFISRNPAVI